MRSTLLPLFLIFLTHSQCAKGLCALENGTIAYCNELEDVKYIDTYNLETLRAPFQEPVLHSGYFVNLTTLRHLDLSNGAIQQIEPGSFNNLNNLRSLNLAENYIGHFELGSVDGLNHLHSLNIRKNRFQQLPPALARLKILKHLEVYGNPLQCNCATLRVRDLLLKRGVKITKKILCSGPKNIKGSSLFKLDTATICHFEEQDREMQNDQAYKESGQEFSSGDLPDKEEESEEGSAEYVEDSSEVSEAPTAEVETPLPISELSTPTVLTSDLARSTESVVSTEFGVPDESELSTQSAVSFEKPLENDEEIFDSEEKEASSSTVAPVMEKRKIYKDSLFYPVEGSGDGDEGSGEGSGAGDILEKSEEKEEKSSSGGILDFFYSVLVGTTETVTTKQDLDLEEELFIHVTSPKEVEEDSIIPKRIDSKEAIPSTTEATTSTMVTTNAVEIIEDTLHDVIKVGKVKADEGNVSDELAEVSPTKQSKKGMGSYIVLAGLLAILATLIGFAACKGDFCRKKRKRSDVENGTELKDMQKALLEMGNSTQPKVASNGNVESTPLVQDPAENEETTQSNNRQVMADVPNSADETAKIMEPVKPSTASTPREKKETPDANSIKDESLSARSSFLDAVINNGPWLPEVNEPPLSPGAQRVKITLQENPDSVPKTPILITRTMAGENLVKMP